MRHTIGSTPRITLVLLLIAGCADNDATSASEQGFGATTLPSTTTLTTGPAAPTSTGADASGTGSTTDTAGDVTATTGDATTTGSGGSSETGAVDETGATEPTGSTGASEGTGVDTEAGVSFAAAVWPIFDEHCSCHEDSNGAGGLRLTADDAYANLVGVPSEDLPEMLLAAPGSPKESYLWHKLNNTQKEVGGKGKRMPPKKDLDPAVLALIQQWIEEGAQP